MTESHGTEPLIEALKKPEDWQYFDPLGGAQGEWKDFTIIGGNSNLSLYYFTGLDWRRKPVEKREPMLARAQFSIVKLAERLREYAFNRAFRAFGRKHIP